MIFLDEGFLPPRSAKLSSTSIDTLNTVFTVLTCSDIFVVAIGFGDVSWLDAFQPISATKGRGGSWKKTEPG